jgi:DNA-binding response OmpR family regulator
MQGSILIVEDDPIIRELVTEYLAGLGRQVHAAGDGESALLHCLRQRPAIVLLDILLPDRDGLSLIREIKRLHPQAGVILISSKGSPVDRVVGLEMGADDYLPKPFELTELVARIKALERRDQAIRSQEQTHRWFSGHCLDLGAFRLQSPDGTSATLTEGECRVLAELARIPGQVVPRQRLLDLLGRNGEPAASRSLDVLISRLRLKLGDAPGRPILVTVYGIGYRLDDLPPPAP